MKRCPECRRDYYDDTLSFCLNDGTELLYGLSPDEPATAILHSTADSGEGQTRAQVNTTNETGMLPSESMPRPASSAEYLVSQVKEHKKGVLLGLVSILVIAGAAFGVYKFAGGKQAGSTPSFESMKITKLTDTGRAGSAAISPDGKYVVHVKEDAGQQSLWVVHIATGSNVQIITPAEAIYGRMTFSPDGNYIYFRRRETGETNAALYLIPVLGGEPKKINPHVSSPVTFSPDGKRFAFVRKQSGDSIMLIANADGTGEHPVATAQSPESFEGSGPAWSPDGEGIATAMAVSNEAGGRHSKVVEVRVEDGSIKPIGSQKWSNVSRVAWLADGSGLIAACSEIGSNTSQVYQISYPSGEARKITNDLNNYHDISLTADSSSMVTVQVDPVLNIWSAPDGDASRSRQLTRGAGKYDGLSGVRWTPDGKIVYVSLASLFTPNVWIMNGDGSNPRQLTQNGGRSPVISPDGRYMVFTSLQAEAPGLWRVDIDGGNPKQLTDKGGVPNVSPDGRWVIYAVTDPGGAGLWKVSIESGEPVQLTEHDSTQPAVSPDGRSIVYLYREQQNSQWRIAIIPSEGGQPTKFLDAPPGFHTVQTFEGGPQALHWLPDGRSLAYIVPRDDVSNVWSMPIDGRAPKQLTNFTSDQIAWFDLSRDGKPTLFSRGTTTKDVVLISGFRK